MASVFLRTWLNGKVIGQDQFGNTYYEAKCTWGNGRPKRWVVYKGSPEASMVPPEWHGWLHYTSHQPLTDVVAHSWQHAHRPNATGTPDAYHPVPTTSVADYQPWTPDQSEK